MYLDILIVLLFLLSAYKGYKIGLIYSLLKTFKWISAVIISFLFLNPTKSFLLKHFNGSNVNTNENLITFIPENIGETLLSPISELIISVVAFFILFLISNIILGIIINFFKPTDNHSTLSGVNRFLGLLLGMVKGALLVSIIICVMLPISDMFFHNLGPVLRNNLNSSYISKYIYDTNPLWLGITYLLK